MTVRISLDLGSVDARDEESSLSTIAALVEALAAVNERFLRRHNGVDLTLYECAKLRYVDDGGAIWKDITEVLRTRTANCQSLSAWRLAELRIMGEEDAQAHIVLTTEANGNGEPRNRFHVQVRRVSGEIEDPSKRFRELRVVK